MRFMGCSPLWAWDVIAREMPRCQTRETAEGLAPMRRIRFWRGMTCGKARDAGWEGEKVGNLREVAVIVAGFVSGWAGPVAVEMSALRAEVGFVEKIEAGFAEDGGGEGGVVDVDDDGGADFFGGDEGVAVVDINFGGEEGLGDFGEAVAGGGHFDGDEVADGEAVVGLDEFLGGGVGVVEDEADDGAIETLDDGEGEDADLGGVEGGEQVGEGTDAIFGEDGDLADGGDVAATVDFRFFSNGRHLRTVADFSDFVERRRGVAAYSTAGRWGTHSWKPFWTIETHGGGAGVI